MLFGRKQIIMVQTEQVKSHNNERKNNNYSVTSELVMMCMNGMISISLLSGDTIIDLGTPCYLKTIISLSSEKESGRTRILVPLGIAISLEHATLVGNVQFEEEQFALKNESIKIYSNDYDENPRRLKIITNTLLGDIEVIRA